MSDSFLDHLPSYERQRLKRRMSPEAYEKLREKVKGPEDLEKELAKSEHLAELHFALESDEALHDSLKSRVDEDLRERGIEEIFDTEFASPEATKSLEAGKFRLAVTNNPSTHTDQLMALPEGNVQEKIPVKTSMSEQYAAQAIQTKHHDDQSRSEKKAP